ncbi:hypothetical protein TrRE_jg4409 [Triparma retinervis]|uniref:Apyrase n=1 Tax=Triparma retinervis TaxID=2557542 RepID=A0A9W7CFD7_9STRA|nr:hypothetical protein TrRE_jg4409 [Triparma retinervis]
MVVDAGSTGSRLFIYDISDRDISDRDISDRGSSDATVVKVGSIKTTPGLSCFIHGCNPEKYPTPSDQYMKLVRYANSIIPPEYRPSTDLTILATAGMRMLSEEDQNSIYSSLLSGLSSEPDFQYSITSISTLRGDLEGYYGLVSSNHLLHYFGELTTHKDGYRPHGSLDMGGSSTQITFLPGDRGPAIDLIRERSGVFANLYFIDIDGIRHPKIRGRFIAMSLYFFALDCLRVVGGDRQLAEGWPRPTMNEVLKATEGFCGMDWGELEPQKSTIHQWTRDWGLEHRCFEAVYIATVLRDAYGFEEDGRRVQFRFDIGGEEVEWTRGMVMVEKGGK